MNSYKFGEWAEHLVCEKLNGQLGRDVDIFAKGRTIEIKASRIRLQGGCSSWLFQKGTKKVDYYLYLGFGMEDNSLKHAWLFTYKQHSCIKAKEKICLPSRRRKRLCRYREINLEHIYAHIV